MTVESLIAIVAIDLPLFIIGWLLAPAFTNISISASPPHPRGLPYLMQFAGALSKRRTPQRSRVRKSSSRSESDDVFIWLGAALVVVTLYLQFRVVVLVAISAIALVIAVAGTVSIVSMSRQGVVLGNRRLRFVILSLYVSSMVGFVNVYLLWHPPAGGTLFTDFMREYGETGTFANIEGVVFIAYQVFGAGSYLLVALFSIAFAVAIMTAINLHIGTPGAWLWRVLHRASAFTWTWKAIPIVVVVATLSILFSGGWSYNWLAQLPELTLP